MGTNDEVIVVAVELFDQGVDTGIQQIVLLPRGSDEDLLLACGYVLGLFCRTCLDQLVGEGVTELHQGLFGQTVDLLGGSDLSGHVGTGAEDGIEFIQSSLAEAHVNTHHIMGDVDVLHVLLHQGALDEILVEIGGGHDHHVCLQLHHQGDELLEANVVGLDPRLLLGDLEDHVARIVGDVMDGHTGLLQERVNDGLEVLVESALLGVEDHVLVHDGEKPLVVLLFPCQILLVCRGMLTVAVQLFQLLQGAAALFQLLIIHVFFGVDHGVEDIHLHDGEDVTRYPVHGDSRGNADTQVQGDTHRHHHESVLAELTLLVLDHVGAVLGKAQQPGGDTRHHGNQDVRSQHLCGNGQQVDPQEGDIEALHLGDHRSQSLGRHAGDHRGRGDGSALDGIHDHQLVGRILGIRLNGLCQGLDHPGIHAEQVVQRVVDGLHHTQQQNDLQDQGDEGQKRMVVLFFEELGLLIREGIHVAVVIGLQEVHRGLDLDHIDGILMHPHRKRKQHDLGGQGEQHDGPAVIADDLPAPLHQVSEGDAYIVHNIHVDSSLQINRRCSCRGSISQPAPSFSSPRPYRGSHTRTARNSPHRPPWHTAGSRRV